MSAALDHSGEHGESINRFEIGDPTNFSASFLEQRMTLLVSWMFGVLSSRSRDLTKAENRKFQSTLADHIDGGLEGLQAAASEARDGVLDTQLLGIAEAILDLPLEELFRTSLFSPREVLKIVSTLREEWENRPVVIQAKY